MTDLLSMINRKQSVREIVILPSKLIKIADFQKAGNVDNSCMFPGWVCRFMM